MTGFLEEVHAATTRPTASLFDQVCAALGPDDWAEFLTALDDPAVPYTALETVLAGRGVPVSDSTLRTWRQKRASRG